MPRPPVKSWPWAIICDGRVSRAVGVLTPCAHCRRERVYPKGTGYITDLGMTGASGVCAGHRAPAVGGVPLGGLPGRYNPRARPLQGAIFTPLDSATGLCTAVEQGMDIR